MKTKDLDIYYIPDEKNMTTQQYMDFLEEQIFEDAEQPHEEETPVSISNIDIKDFTDGK